MEFWEDLSKKLSDAADYTVKETEKITAIAKIKYKLSAAKNKLDLLYQSVGKLKYEEFKGQTGCEELYEGFFAQITSVLEEVKALEAEMAKLRNYRICPGCNQKIARDMAFCPRCGMKQEEDAPAADAASDNSAETENTDSAEENANNGKSDITDGE